MKWAQSMGVLKGFTGHTTIAHLTAVTLKGMKIPLIPIEEQTAIQTKIQNLNRVREEMKLAVESSRALQKSLINQVF